MAEQILLPPDEAPARKCWRPWKLVCLAIFAVVLIAQKALPGTVIVVGSLCGAVAIVNLLWFGVRFLKDRFFWRVRNRLIGSFIFMGFIPLLLLLGVIAASAYLLFGQMAWQRLDAAMRENIGLVSEINAELAKAVAPADSSSLNTKAPQIFAKRALQFPRLASRLLHRRPDGTLEELSMYDPHSLLPKLSPHPGLKWLAGGERFEGLLHEGRSAVLTSFQSLPASGNFYVETMAPMDGALALRLAKEKSIYARFQGRQMGRPPADGRAIGPTGPEPADRALPSSREKSDWKGIEAMEAARRSDSRGMVYWMTPLRGKEYRSGEGTFVGSVFFSVPRTTLSSSLTPDNFQNMMSFGFLTTLVGVSLTVVLISMIAGFVISRQISGSVHDLYQGIVALQKGDLQHRMPIRRRDQLGVLAHSFNQMSASITRLLDEVVEKKQLERDLEIAREVQEALFPKQLPHPPGMSIFGGCKPARTVSGDYYDFIVADETHLFIIVGDISGKGISAALLMANLQALIRNQLSSIKNDDPEAVAKSLADVMAQLNQQVFLNSPPEKFITLFLSSYDAVARRLWYCNAGHPPPVVVSAHSVQSLEVTGMAVGMFADVTYQSQSIDLAPGALLAVFTDGATEAVNKDDEEFGEERMKETLRQAYALEPKEIWEFTLAKIGEWQSGEGGQADIPPDDDITLIVSKIAPAS